MHGQTCFQRHHSMFGNLRLSFSRLQRLSKYSVSRSTLSSVVALSKLFTPTASEMWRRAVIWIAAALRRRHHAPAPSSLHISLLAAITSLPAATSTCHAQPDGDLRYRARGCSYGGGPAISRCCSSPAAVLAVPVSAGTAEVGGSDVPCLTSPPARRCVWSFAAREIS